MYVRKSRVRVLDFTATGRGFMNLTRVTPLVFLFVSVGSIYLGRIPDLISA